MSSQPTKDGSPPAWMLPNETTPEELARKASQAVGNAGLDMAMRLAQMKLPPAWFNPASEPTPPASTAKAPANLPPAWLLDGVVPAPSIPAPQPAGPKPIPPVIVVIPQPLTAIPDPPPPPEPDPEPVITTLPEIVIVGEVPKADPPAGPQPQAPSPIIPPIIIPQPVVPVAVTPPVIAPATTPDDWRTVVRRALISVAQDKANSQFQRWAEDPRVIFTLIASESGGDKNALKKEGFSKKLGRDYFSFGIFQINEIWAPGHYKIAPQRIGPRLAAMMPPFPQTPTWTKAQAAQALLAWPHQVWYGMVLLTWFSIYKHTYFSQVVGQVATASAHLPNQKEANFALDAAIGASAQAAKLGVPVELVLLKAYWAASSPEGVAKMVRGGDPRITAAARMWPVT